MARDVRVLRAPADNIAALKFALEQAKEQLELLGPRYIVQVGDHGLELAKQLLSAVQSIGWAVSELGKVESILRAAIDDAVEGEGA